MFLGVVSANIPPPPDPLLLREMPKFDDLIKFYMLFLVFSLYKIYYIYINFIKYNFGWYFMFSGALNPTMTPYR